MKILKEGKIDFQIVEYLKTPLSAGELAELSQKMDIPPSDFIRKREKVFKELGLKDKLDDNTFLFKVMAEHPVLMERAIAVKGDRAVLCRPPERILELVAGS